MPDSYTNLLYHLVFSTKDRRPLIKPDKEIRLYEYMGGIVRELGGISLELNGTDDHVHQLVKLRPDKAVSDVLRDLKSNATGWMHEVFPSLKDFSWQRGYGAFTVSQSNIRRQKEHHQKISFRDEFIHILKANKIKYDARFVGAIARSAGLRRFLAGQSLGFRFASPQALCFRLLRRLSCVILKIAGVRKTRLRRLL